MSLSRRRILICMPLQTIMISSQDDNANEEVI